MFPLRDTIPALRPPVVTVSLIVINALVFLMELGSGPGLDRIVGTFGLVPVRELYVISTDPLAVHQWLPPFLTSMFLHAGFGHAIGNLWFLWIFGDNVEDRLGRRRFLGFYLGCGVVAALTQVLTAPESGIPIIGASGAISGVLGAYMVLFPHARVITFIPIFIIPYFIQVPAVFFLGVWFLQQVLAGGISLGTPHDAGGVAWWAHAGGFLAGVLYAWRWRHHGATRVDVLDDVPWRRRGGF